MIEEFFGNHTVLYEVVPTGLKIFFKILCLLSATCSAIFVVKFYKLDITVRSRLAHMFVMQFSAMTWLFLALFLSFLWESLPYLTTIIAVLPIIVHTFVLSFLYGNRIVKELKIEDREEQNNSC